MTTGRRRLAVPVGSLARLIVTGAAVLAVTWCGSVPASAAAGTSQVRAGSHDRDG
ncbi:MULTISPECIES: hypothetical protein [Streptomyces]|uniref:Uncharacterized protein n=2 Tax=Streptomyces TaxID=1883 RepID=A0ABU4K064_9ACTN|nr:hypothetical protein [Streptomyces roseolus]MDX2290914.1 hypothetical protein [Streptomyces roseolus]